MSASLATARSINYQFNMLKKTSRNFYFLTLTSNKHPEVLTVNTDIYQAMLHSTVTEPSHIINYCYELNKCGQLHCHALIFSKKAIYMKQKIAQFKKEYPDYHTRIDKLKTEDDRLKVYHYINKNKGDDPRELYYRVARFYEMGKVKDPDNLKLNYDLHEQRALYPWVKIGFEPHSYFEDFSDLADYGFQYNNKTGRFSYVKFDNPTKLFIN